MKIIKRGILLKDVYESTGRYPLDYGEAYTKEEIDGMFELSYPKGTKFKCYRENGYDVWYLSNGDGGWTDWRNEKHPNHSLLDNLKILPTK